MSWSGIPEESQMIATPPPTPPPMSTVWATWSASSSPSNFLTHSGKMAVVQGNICDLMSGWDELERVSLRPRRLVWTLLLLAPIWLNLTSWHMSPTPPFPFLFFLIGVKTQQSTLNICLGGLLSTPLISPPPHTRTTRSFHLSGEFLSGGGRFTGTMGLQRRRNLVLNVWVCCFRRICCVFDRNT